MSDPNQNQLQPTMKRKKLDSRIPALISNGVALRHRSLFIVVGDRGRDQVVTLHYLLSKARVSARPSVLWCYKKDLGFSSHRKKRMNQIKKQIARGQREVDEDDPFELFVSSTSIRYTYYKETENILGTTFGMCVLQDFEALTPNLLARTIETVEGGGIIVILLKTMNSLKQLYTMTMDVHARYRTEAYHDTVARFNERFLLSLGGCETCLVVDDELNVLPLSAGKHVKPISRIDEHKLSGSAQELAELKTSLEDSQPLSSLVATAKTLDQARAVLTFTEAIAEKTLRSTVCLTASRGRGKSASLGIAMAAAIAYGYSNIFITSPSPENLKTVFEFMFKGFDGLGYEEHLDYDIIQSTNPDFAKAVVRVNVFKQHRQTIQYIQPSDASVLAQAELLVIDEAAAIPLPLVKALLGPYLVFMSSTINGYEGTGRSLSLKLISQLREQSIAGNSFNSSNATGVTVGRDGKEKKSTGGPSEVQSTAPPPSLRILREIKLSDPIRYNSGDPVETWLTNLLCLDACTPSLTASNLSLKGCPHPSQCELFYVNRDTLFSYHKVSEAFLQRMMSLYVASHYKNSPNDLQLMSDAPAHHLFVLLPPINQVSTGGTSTLPEPLVVIQIALEGNIAAESAQSALARGTARTNGDLIPWVMATQFQDDDFSRLNGARIVRIATHPDFIGMGYGLHAIKKLEEYYSGKSGIGLDEDDGAKKGGSGAATTEVRRVSDEALENETLAKDQIGVRDPSSMPPLLLRLHERPPREHLHWIGVSYGITPQLHKFWKKCGFVPVYCRQTQNDLTGEHTTIMLKPLIHQTESSSSSSKKSTRSEVIVSKNSKWVQSFSWDFRRRFIELLGYQFKKFSPLLVLSILEASSNGRPADLESINTPNELARHFTPFDIKRLESYTQNLLDYHVILDLIPRLATLFFLGYLNTPEHLFSGVKTELKHVALSPVQSAILVAVGLQRKTLDEAAPELGIAVSQIMALFGKVVKKCSNYFQIVEEAGVSAEFSAGAGKQKTATFVGIKLSNGEVESDVEAINGLTRDVNDDEAWDPVKTGLDEDLEEAGDEVMERLKEKQREMIDGLNLSQFAITAGDEEFVNSVKGTKNSTSRGSIQVKNDKSTKKRKFDSASGTASGLAAGVRGDKSGIFDPQAASGKTEKGKKGARR
ncbi:N-acetyltransferase 10 [Physocladia obscura]|uniref:RNA cytidine acetyltransferase n=1 Tax=Physocladia obscura TaxID=109957 RepID=A0AAD5XEY4_9FUNG|nr:N-acetyltransferase 10 [Physocladia obscura]